MVWISLFCKKIWQLSYSWFQTSQTGGQWYSDTSPFSIPILLTRLLSDASTTGSIRRFGRRRFLSGASRKSCRRKVGRDRRVGQRAAGVRRYRSLTSRPADSKGSSSQGAMVFLGCTPGSTVVEHSTPNPRSRVWILPLKLGFCWTLFLHLVGIYLLRI